MLDSINDIGFLNRLPSPRSSNVVSRPINHIRIIRLRRVDLVTVFKGKRASSRVLPSSSRSLLRSKVQGTRNRRGCSSNLSKFRAYVY